MCQLKTGDIVFHKLLGELTIKEVNTDSYKVFEIPNLELETNMINEVLCTEEEYWNREFTKEDIAEIIRLRGIKEIQHLTTINNALNIIYNGIIPRSFMKCRNYSNKEDFNNQINNITLFSDFSDAYRREDRTDCSSFSITHINHKIYNAYRMENSSLNYCVITLTPEILVENYKKEYFCPHNAASKDIKDNLDLLNRGQYFNIMFKKQVNIALATEEKIFERKDNQEGNLTTSNQAEILINNIISPDKIINIRFFSDFDKKYFINTLNKKHKNVFSKTMIAIDYDSKDIFSDYLNRSYNFEIINRALTDNSYKNSYQRENHKEYDGLVNADLATYGDSIISFGYCTLMLDKEKNLSVEKAKYESDKFFVDVIGKYYNILDYLKFDEKDDKMLQEYDYEKGKSNNANRTKYIATAVEALMGAIYQVEGFDAILNILSNWITKFKQE